MVEGGTRQTSAQLLTVLAVSFGPFSVGLSKGYSSPALASLTAGSPELGLTAQQSSWVASLSLLGALLGGAASSLALAAPRRTALMLVRYSPAACHTSILWQLLIEQLARKSVLCKTHTYINGLLLQPAVFCQLAADGVRHQGGVPLLHGLPGRHLQCSRLRHLSGRGQANCIVFYCPDCAGLHQRDRLPRPARPAVRLSQDILSGVTCL